MENRKSTVLLTVIAVATLLVAVVGATFAYFTAQSAGGKTIDTQVTTTTGASSQFIVDNQTLSIQVTDENFTKNGSQDNSTLDASARVLHQAPSSGASTLCYKVGFLLVNNNFNYTENNTKPELMLEVKRTDATTFSADTEDLDNNGLSVSSASLLPVYGAVNTKTPATTLAADTVAPATVNTMIGDVQYVGHSAITGFDLTELRNDTTSQAYDRYYFSSNSSGKDYFTLEVTQGTTRYVDWEFRLTFVNYPTDQSNIENAKNNAEKQFNANLFLEPYTGSSECAGYVAPGTGE